MLLDLTSLEGAGQQGRHVGEKSVCHADRRRPQHRAGDHVGPLLPSRGRRLRTGIAQQLAGEGVRGEIRPSGK